MPAPVLTADEQAGVKAIQFLQKQTGIDEPAERALANWRKMSHQAQQQIFRAYSVCQGPPIIP